MQLPAAGCYTYREMPCVREKTKAAAVAAWCTAAIFLLAGSASSAQESATPRISADQLVRETVANEIAANNNPAVKHMFH
ncbi:MAG TPA: hypothetical protein VE866_14020, partial [Candidatus Binatia bacterium]|nr:hypothetical protein [Candidatus Binatia bacterium]